MTPEQIAKAREIIAAFRMDSGHLMREDNFMRAAETGWPEALDEIERLSKLCGSLGTNLHRSETIRIDLLGERTRMWTGADLKELGELQAENERLNRVLCGEKPMLRVIGELKCEIDKLRAENERLKIDYDEANEGLHRARKAINAKSEEVVHDIEHLLEERDSLRADLEAHQPYRIQLEHQVVLLRAVAEAAEQLGIELDCNEQFLHVCEQGFILTCSRLGKALKAWRDGGGG